MHPIDIDNESMPTRNKLSSEEIFAIVREKFPDLVLEERLEVQGDPCLVVKPDQLLELATFCRDDERLRFDLLSCISGVDYPERQQIEVVYCLDSTVHNHWLILIVPLKREGPKVPSVEQVWRTADWQERETYDLVGVIFEGHHNLVRILCAEDWVGHPLRKDYVMPDTYHGIKNVIY
jgi:NADH-quinone oxidoreductase subunit C